MKRVVLILIVTLSVTGCGGTNNGSSEGNSSARNQANDAELNRGIRRAIMQNENMSVNAQNIYIDSENGKVTLRGAVDDTAERERVIQIARAVGGVSGVNDELEVLNKAVAAKSSEPVQ